MINLRTADEMNVVGRGGAIIAGLLAELDTRVAPGVSTEELDSLCDEYIVSHEGAVPAFKGLYGFPGSVCTSVNEEVVHGIPSATRVLRDGDIVSIDVGVKFDGWCSDSAWTFRVGEVSDDVQRLLDVTERSLWAAIEASVPGNHVGDIGAAVMRTVAGTSFGIIKDLVGHGVGRDVHEEPQVPNYAWPTYAAHPNYGAVTYPKQYSPSAWPYIGPFYPYPQVPLGWRKVTLEWDDGWWFLDFSSRR